MKKVELVKQYMLSYQSIWEEEPHIAASELLQDVPTAPAVEQIAYLLNRLMNIKVDVVNFHAHELSGWMMHLTRNTQERTLKFISEHDVFNMPHFVLTNRRICLMLLEELLSCSARPGNKLAKEHQDLIFKSLLILNSKYVTSQELIFNWDGTGDEHMFLDIILPARLGNLGISRRMDYQVQIIKACYFFEFCRNDFEYQALLTIFLNNYGFNSYQQYITAILRPYLSMNIATLTPKFHIDPTFKSERYFFERFMINNRTIISEDFKTLRAFPIYKSTADTFIILFSNFFVDKFYKGLLFDFISILQNAGNLRMTFGKFKNDLGNRFSEFYIFYRAMNNCFRNYGSVRKTGVELKALLKSNEPDYFIRHGRKVFLFEFKDILLPANVKASESAAVIQEELIEKLEISKRNRSKFQSKAVEQLFYSIRSILSGTYIEKGVDVFDPSQIMIYPILVHTEVALEAEGINYFLKERLNKMLKDVDMPKHRIKDLVLINVDLLISIQDLFANREIILATCINEFIAYTDTGGPMNRMIPFDEYLKFHIVGKKKSFLTMSEEFDKLLQELAVVPD